VLPRGAVDGGRWTVWTCCSDGPPLWPLVVSTTAGQSVPAADPCLPRNETGREERKIIPAANSLSLYVTQRRAHTLKTLWLSDFCERYSGGSAGIKVERTVRADRQAPLSRPLGRQRRTTGKLSCLQRFTGRQKQSGDSFRIDKGKGYRRSRSGFRIHGGRRWHDGSCEILLETCQPLLRSRERVFESRSSSCYDITQLLFTIHSDRSKSI
jgi:hypothetical protein